MSNERFVDITEKTFRRQSEMLKKHDSILNTDRGQSRAKLNRKSKSSLVKIKITVVTDDNTYTGRIINNRTDKTEITGDDVTVKALDHDNGEFPVNTILDCSYDSENSWYEPVNYSVAY